MNKKVLIGAAAGFAVAGCIAAATKKQNKPKQSIWDKMRQGMEEMDEECMEEMSEDFPPRIIDNIEATKANTDEILTLLRHQQQSESDDIEVTSSS